jgi:two-component system, LytTR family, response regulator
MSISCIVIDDEPNAVQLLQDYIAKTPGLQLTGSFYDGVDALAFLRQKNTVDIIFTDINMPLLSGMELAGLLPRTQKFIFTTAYSEHALSSFSYYVVDYLLKPISFARFTQAVTKIQQSMQAPPPETGREADFIFVKSGKQFIKIVLADILYISGAKEYINIHTAKENLLVYKRMKEMEGILPAYFTRVHHSYIINTNYLEKVEPAQVVVAQTAIPVSEGYKNNLQAVLNNRVL